MSEGMSGIAPDCCAAPVLAAAVGGAMKGAKGFLAPLLAAMFGGTERPIWRPVNAHTDVVSTQHLLACSFECCHQSH